jgi:hypothetical protein
MGKTIIFIEIILKLVIVKERPPKRTGKLFVAAVAL